MSTPADTAEFTRLLEIFDAKRRFEEMFAAHLSRYLGDRVGVYTSFSEDKIDGTSASVFLNFREGGTYNNISVPKTALTGETEESAWSAELSITAITPRKGVSYIAQNDLVKRIRAAMARGLLFACPELNALEDYFINRPTFGGRTDSIGDDKYDQSDLTYNFNYFTRPGIWATKNNQPQG